MLLWIRFGDFPQIKIFLQKFLQKISLRLLRISNLGINPGIWTRTPGGFLENDSFERFRTCWKPIKKNFWKVPKRSLWMIPSRNSDRIYRKNIWRISRKNCWKISRRFPEIKTSEGFLKGNFLDDIQKELLENFHKKFLMDSHQDVLEGFRNRCYNELLEDSQEVSLKDSQEKSCKFPKFQGIVVVCAEGTPKDSQKKNS